MFRITPLTTVALILSGGALADPAKPNASGTSSTVNESVGSTVAPPDETARANEYWTPERMRDAKPKPLVPVNPERGRADKPK